MREGENYVYACPPGRGMVIVIFIARLEGFLEFCSIEDRKRRVEA